MTGGSPRVRTCRTILNLARTVSARHYAEYSVLEKLLTEQTNPASASIDTLPTADVLRIINGEDRTVAEAVAREIPAIARAVDAIVAQLQAGGRLFYIGAGTSGRLGVPGNVATTTP